MNKKSKNKNRNKPSTPVAQKGKEEGVKTIECKEKEIKEEILSKDEVKFDLLEEKKDLPCENKEVTETNLDSPKKPKRNRNKKKKCEPEEISSQTSQIPMTDKLEYGQNIEKSEGINTKKHSDTVKSSKSSYQTENENKENTLVTSKNELLCTESDKNNLNITKQDEKQIIEKQATSSTSTEQKEKKKHKKNKKRNDSEKSEEILICTAAFQKILVEEETDSKKKDDIGSKNTKIEVELVSESSTSEATVLSKKNDPEKTNTIKDSEEPHEPVNNKQKERKQNKNQNEKNKENVEAPKTNVNYDINEATKKVSEEIDGKNNICVKIDNIKIETTPEPCTVTELMAAESQKNISDEEKSFAKCEKDELVKSTSKKKKNKSFPVEGSSDVTDCGKKVIDDKFILQKSSMTSQSEDLIEKSNTEKVSSTESSDPQQKLLVKSLETKDLTQFTNRKNTGTKDIISKDILDTDDIKQVSDTFKRDEKQDDTVIKKQKAKIAKPIDKKSKQITDLPKTLQEDLSAQETLLKTLEVSKKEEKHIENSSNESKCKTLDSKSIEQLPQVSEATDIIKHKVEEKNVAACINLPSAIEKDEKMKSTEIHEKDSLEFKNMGPGQEQQSCQTETELPKRQKKRGKDTITAEALKQEIQDTSTVIDNLDTLVKIEQIQDVKTNVPLITPDQIKYPRPASADGGDIKNKGKDVTVTDITDVDVEENILKQKNHKLTSLVPVEKVIEEKKDRTDLKSKVIEVNKDMEDLKISIEKSLAELTAMENQDQESERTFEKNLQESQKKIDTIEEHLELSQNSPNDKKINIKHPEPLTIKKTEVHLTDVTYTDESNNKKDTDNRTEDDKIFEDTNIPIVPSRKDNKGKHRKKKEHQEICSSRSAVSSTVSSSTSATEQKETKESQSCASSKDAQSSSTKNEQEQGKKQRDEQKKGKQQSNEPKNEDSVVREDYIVCDDPLDKFEDALASSADNLNVTFDMTVKETSGDKLGSVDENPDKDTKENEIKNENVPQPKNLLGHPDIPVQSNKIDYKKEKDKTPSSRQAKVQVKDGADLSKDNKYKTNKECQTTNKPKILKPKNESSTYLTNDNEEFIYKYSFRNVFLPSACHVCKKKLSSARIECSFCHLFFYCSQKHKDKDWNNHQALCFAISTITHLKGQKHIYADSKNVTGQNYRLQRMQMIISCEKILKRKLAAWEQEALLYPRLCADPGCREWKTVELEDCGACQQISYCSKYPEHLPTSHARWCKSYSLYQRLVVHQLLYGRIEPTIPKKCMLGGRMSDNINRVLADLYDEKIDMDDMQYASLTQIATAPLTTAYSYQMYDSKMENTFKDQWQKKSSFTVHVIEAELQFEADSLNKWEIFLLHLKPEVQKLRVVLIGTDLNPSNLPLDLLGNVRLCENCINKNRRVIFEFKDKLFYDDYCKNEEFVKPDIVCAFNTAIHRYSTYHSTDIWMPALKCIFKLQIPFLLTAYTMAELQKDIAYIEKRFEGDFNMISEAKFNPFASVRPDRNFISDDDMPLLFKNYCFSVVIGVF